jgi:hypothetical protein
MPYLRQSNKVTNFPVTFYVVDTTAAKFFVRFIVTNFFAVMPTTGTFCVITLGNRNLQTINI